MRKNILILSAVAVVAVFASCDKAAEMLFKSFEAPLNFNVSMDPAVAGMQANLGTTTVNYNLDAEVKKATSDQFDGSIVKQIYVSKIDINLSNADQTNKLSSFESLSVTFGTNASNTVVLGPFPIPASATSSYLIDSINCPNIRQFFNGSNVNFVVSGKAKTSTNKTLQAAVTATLKFDK
jgi:hypothetical protein